MRGMERKRGRNEVMLRGCRVGEYEDRRDGRML
jgi:hypothetical protein